MSHNFYTFGRLFLGLGVVAGVLQSILQFLVGPQMFWLGSFIGWLLVTSIISLVGSFFLLKYYHYKKYSFAFYSGLIGTVPHLLLLVIFLMVLTSRLLENWYIPTLVIALITGVVYGISLIFSNAGKSPWLRWAGISIVLTGLLFGAGLIWSRIVPQAQVAGTLDKINQLIALATRLIPVLFIIQFSEEIKLLKAEGQNATPSRSSDDMFGFAGIVAVLCTVAFGLMIARDSFKSLYWSNANSERARELVNRSETRTFVSNKGDSLRYLLMKPLDYDPQKKYPLVVCLPYGGYEAPPAQWLSNDVIRRKYPAFLFVPYSPEGSSWGGVPGRFAIDSLVYETLRTLDEPAIDEKRRYVSGVSLGGYGSWQFISTHPEMFAAAVPVCGAGDPELATKIVDVPVWAFHGAKDRNVPVRGSREMIEAIKKAGGEPKYTEYPDQAHNIWEHVIKTPGLLDWMFKQKRE